MDDDLEHLDYGPDVPARARAAALRQLSRRDATQASPQADPVSDADGTTLATEPNPSHDARRRLIAFALGPFALGLLLGGIAIAAVSSSHDFGPWKSPLADADSTEPSTVVQNPVALFGRTAGTADNYLRDSDSGQDSDSQFRASSTRLVFTSNDGGRLWIARKAGSGDGFCLISEDSEASNTTVSLECANSARFGRTGLRVIAAGYEAKWADAEITIDQLPK